MAHPFPPFPSPNPTVSTSVFHSSPWWADLNDFAARHQSLLLIALLFSLAPVLLVAAFSSFQLYAQLGRREAQQRRLWQRSAAAAAEAAAAGPLVAPSSVSARLHEEELGSGSASPAVPRARSAKQGGVAASLPLTSTAHSVYATFTEQHRRSVRSSRKGDSGAKR